MNRTFVVDLPALCQGNLHGVDIALFHESLGLIKGLKHPVLLLGDSDEAILASNSDYAFTNEVWKFLLDVQISMYGPDAYRANLTSNPIIIDDGYDKDLS